MHIHTHLGIYDLPISVPQVYMVIIGQETALWRPNTTRPTQNEEDIGY